MKVIKGRANLKPGFPRPILTLGMFDGVHLGHQRIIREVVRQAQVYGGTSIVLTFDPHPVNILGKKKGKEKGACLITALEHRIALLGRLNVDVCIVINFNRRFSRIYAQDFIKQILYQTLRVHTVIIGSGFRFGKKQTGCFALLKRFSKIYGFRVSQIKKVKINGQIVSSTKIRGFIQNGQIKKANKFLDRCFSISGRIEQGSSLGQRLGYPTANLTPLPEQEILPKEGVYVVTVKLDGKIYPGLLNIGRRPTFSSNSKSKSLPTVEVHILKFRKNIYHKSLVVFFIQRLRAEKRFASQQQLIKQIKKDEIQAKHILQKEHPPQSHFI